MLLLLETGGRKRRVGCPVNAPWPPKPCHCMSSPIWAIQRPASTLCATSLQTIGIALCGSAVLAVSSRAFGSRFLGHAPTSLAVTLLDPCKTLLKPRGLVLAAFALVGNLQEEVLFRAFWVHRFGRVLDRAHLLTSSGLVFSLYHSFLALTGTATEAAFLHLFTLWEGVVCAWMYVNYGLWAAAICHGGAIFLLSAPASLP